MAKQEHWFFRERGAKAAKTKEKAERLTQLKERVSKARDSHTRYKASQSQASQQPENKQPTAEKAIKQSDKQPVKKEQ